MQILFASQNKGKQAEAKVLFADLAVTLQFPSDYPQLENFNPEETESTFAGNALLKARAYAHTVGIPCIADDSGVIIDGMNGLPGVHSNRWFKGTADERNQEVLNRLTPGKIRTARYLTVACYYDPVSEEYALYEETQEGSIATQITQGEGFDYDRIFIPEGYNQTYSQLGTHIKNKNSQRSRAYKKLHEYLKKKLALTK